MTTDQSTMKMVITEIRIRLDRKRDSNKCQAFVDVTIGGVLVIKNIRIIQGATRMFLQMPQSRDFNGMFHDIVFPCNEYFRDYLEDRVLEQYRKKVGS